MKKVLFLINTLGNGGAERVLVNLVNNIDVKKFDVTLKTLFDVGTNKQLLKKHVKYEYVFKKTFKGYNIVFEMIPNKLLNKLIIKDDYDIIVVYLHGILTKIISNYDDNNFKKIAWLHADMSNSPFLKSFRNQGKLKECFDKYDAIVGVSENVAKSFISIAGYKDKTYVKYNNFDVDYIIGKSTEKIRNNIILDGVVNLCSVGKLDKVKGYDRLLRVANRLIKENILFKLNIIGEGVEKKELQKYIDTNRMNKYVNLLGFKDNPYKYIKNSDLFVCSSLSEGYSSVVVESIILETPVITTRCSGMTEIIGENNEHGVIVENDEESLYKGIKELILDKGKLNFYKNKAIERKQFFSIEKTVGEVERLLEEV